MRIMKLINYCRVGEVGQVGGQIVQTFEEYTIEDKPVISAIIADIKDRSSALNLAWKKSEQESNLADKDATRDDKYRAFFYTVTGATYSPDAEKKAAAQRLSAIFNKYGLEAAGKNYDEESTDLISFLSDLRSAEAVADIAKIEDLSAIVSELKLAQNHFNQAVADWKMASGNDKNKSSATEIKKELVEIINGEFIPFLKVMLKRDKATFEKFAATVSQIISDKNEAVKKRKSKGEEE